MILYFIRGPKIRQLGPVAPNGDEEPSKCGEDRLMPVVMLGVHPILRLIGCECCEWVLLPKDAWPPKH